MDKAQYIYIIEYHTAVELSPREYVWTDGSHRYNKEQKKLDTQGYMLNDSVYETICVWIIQNNV